MSGLPIFHSRFLGFMRKLLILYNKFYNVTYINLLFYNLKNMNNIIILFIYSTVQIPTWIGRH